MTDARCEPLEGERQSMTRHWIQLGDNADALVPAIWVLDGFQGYWTWGGEQRPAEKVAAAGWRYIGPALTPAEVAALRAERDAAVAKCAILTAQAERLIAGQLVADHKDRQQAAELTTLRAEVEKLRAELGRTSGHLADFAHAYPNDCTAEIDAALYCARAALEPQP